MSDLGSKAMLVGLSISAWSAKKYDKRVSREVADNHGTGIEAGRYNKQLLPGDNASYLEVGKVAGAARTEHYRLTLPWTDEGQRILPAMAFDDYTNALKRQKREFENAVAAFLVRYPDMKAYAQTFLNGLYREEDYPRIDKLEGKFSWKLTFNPLPSGDDFRVSLRDEEVTSIRANIEQTTKDAVLAGVADLWARLFDSVGHIAERLGDDKAVFRDSLVGNLKDLCENVLPKLNVLGDVNLEAVRVRALGELGKYDAQILRDSPRIRAEVAKEADAIKNAMAAFMGA